MLIAQKAHLFFLQLKVLVRDQDDGLRDVDVKTEAWSGGSNNVGSEAGEVDPAE
jgi:hypothetical protein